MKGEREREKIQLKRKGKNSRALFGELISSYSYRRASAEN